jgi:hypothetical protein
MVSLGPREAIELALRDHAPVAGHHRRADHRHPVHGVAPRDHGDLSEHGGVVETSRAEVRGAPHAAEVDGSVAVEGELLQVVADAREQHRPVGRGAEQQALAVEAHRGGDVLPGVDATLHVDAVGAGRHHDHTAVAHAAHARGEQQRAAVGEGGRDALAVVFEEGGGHARHRARVEHRAAQAQHRTRGAHGPARLAEGHQRALAERDQRGHGEVGLRRGAGVDEFQGALHLGVVVDREHADGVAAGGAGVGRESRRRLLHRHDEAAAVRDQSPHGDITHALGPRGHAAKDRLAGAARGLARVVGRHRHEAGVHGARGRVEGGGVGEEGAVGGRGGVGRHRRGALAAGEQRQNDGQRGETHHGPSTMPWRREVGPARISFRADGCGGRGGGVSSRPG